MVTSVTSKWHVACSILRLEKLKEPESWTQLHVGGIDGISLTQLLQKHWEWQVYRRRDATGTSKKRVKKHLARRDIKTAVRRVKTKAYHKKNWVDQDVHGWITAASPREWQAWKARRLSKRRPSFAQDASVKEVLKHHGSGST